MVHLIERVADWRGLLERLNCLDARTDRWLCVQPTRSPRLGQICTDIADALGARGNVAANAGHSDLTRGLETWLHHATDNVVILGAANEEALILAIGSADRCGIDLWLVEACPTGRAEILATMSSVVHADEHELLRVLPRPIGAYDRQIYAAHFLEHSFLIQRPPDRAWGRIRDLHLACGCPVDFAVFDATDRSGVHLDRLLGRLFDSAVTPVEALVRLRQAQLKILWREWLLEQDDYATSYQLATLLATGEAPCDPGALGLRLVRGDANRAIRAVAQPPRVLRR